MNSGKHLQHLFFLIKYRFFKKFLSYFRLVRNRFLGMQVGKNTVLPRFDVNWPHQLSLGANCKLEHDIFFKFDGAWSKGPSIRISDNVFIGSGCEFNIRKSIEIGSDALIASGCRFIDHDHGFLAGQLIRKQHGIEQSIKLGEDVWLGCNVIVLKGVEIERGAIVAAGSVVTKSIPSMEIWAGIPAKKMGERRVE